MKLPRLVMYPPNPRLPLWCRNTSLGKNRQGIYPPTITTKKIMGPIMPSWYNNPINGNTYERQKRLAKLNPSGWHIFIRLVGTYAVIFSLVDRWINHPFWDLRVNCKEWYALLGWRKMGMEQRIKKFHHGEIQQTLTITNWYITRGDPQQSPDIMVRYFLFRGNCKEGGALSNDYMRETYIYN